MGAVAARLRAALRERRVSTTALVLLVVVAGGAVLAAAAGARRTASAYPRMLEAANAYDVLVNPDTPGADLDAIEALPQAAGSARLYGQYVALEGPSGEPEFSPPFLAGASDGRLGYEVDRPVNLEGRLPRRDDPDEVALSGLLAEQLGLRVGDRLPLLAFAGESAPPERVDAEVVGIGLFSFDALQEPDDPLTAPILFLAPAFREQHGGGQGNFVASEVRVPGGDAAMTDFSVAAQRLVPGQLFLRTQVASTDKAQRALRPYGVSLAVFAAAAGVAAVLVIGQALTRQLLADASTGPTLSALGMTRGQLLGATVLQAAVVGVGGALGAAALAIGLSPLMPIGPARSLDPDPGLQVDAVVIGLGVLGIVALAVVWGAVVGWRAAGLAAGPEAPPRHSRLGDVLARAGAPAPMAAGLRMAVEPGQGATAVPVRTTLVGAALGLAALVAAITFGAGLDHLLATPRLYGWDWDAAVVAGVGDNVGDDVIRRLPALPSVTGVAEGSYGQVDVEGLSVAAVGLGRDGAPEVHPTMLEGRPAARPEEVVLGTTTLNRLGRRVGDDVELTVGATTLRAHVVGRSVLPKFAAYPGADRTGLGVGAVLTVEGLHRLIPDAGIGFALVRFTPGADTAAGVADLRGTLGPPPPDSIEPPHVAISPQRPDDLVGYDRVTTTPLVLAGLLALLAVGTTAHGLVTATRRRGRDLGLLKAIGFTRRQVSSAVAWQATTVAVVALVVGLPLGVAGGRWLWGLLADRLGAVAQPVTPALAVLVAVPATLVVLNLVAAVPGRRAGAIPPALVLRSE